MARALLDLDDEALARAALILGTTSEVDTVNTALRLVAADRLDDDEHRRFDGLVDLGGDRLADIDVRAELGGNDSIRWPSHRMSGAFLAHEGSPLPTSEAEA